MKSVKGAPWACYLDAIVKATGIDESELLTDIGHDGSQILYPELRPPFCYKGFNCDHLALILLRYGWGVVSVQVPVKYRDALGNIRDPREAINWRDEVCNNYPLVVLSSNHALGFAKDEEIIFPKDFDVKFIQVLVSFALDVRFNDFDFDFGVDQTP